MPLIEIVGADPAIKKIRLKRRFADLPELDKQGVVDFMEAGRTGQGADDINLSSVGREFIKHPDFIEAFNEQQQPKPEPSPQMDVMAPLIQGLMQIIKQTQRPEPHPHGMLRPEYQERVGGGAPGLHSGGFERRLGSAFSQGGVRGLARAHRDMIATDTSYKRFLREK